MNRIAMIGLAMAGAVAFVPAAAVAGTVYNSTPADGWFYGSGNDYSPANTAVSTTDAGDQLYLRMHKTFDVAPASTGSVYSFTLGTDPMSYDWGVDSHTGSFDGVTAMLTFTNLGTGASFSYNPFSIGNDNSSGSGSVQNSGRLNWFPIGFDSNVDDTYRVSLSVSGLEGGPQLLSVDAKLGAGAGAGAVPEPASWALMLGGFGLVGGALRRRKAQVTFA